MTIPGRSSSVLRDYIQLFYTVDDTPAGPQFYFTSHYFFNTLQQCESFVKDNPISPGGGLLSAPAPVWFRFDKAMAKVWIDSSNVQNLGPNLVNGKQLIYLESPRNKGINSKVEKKGYKKPTLSEAGIFDPLFAEFPVDQFIQDLGTLAARLRKARDQRGAEAVLYARGQLVAGSFSIVEVLDYLTKFGILH